MTKTPRPKDIGTVHNMEPVINPKTGEITEAWAAFARALARDQAAADHELEIRIRAERPDWNGVVMFGKVFDTIDDFAKHFDLGPEDFTVEIYKGGKRVRRPRTTKGTKRK